MSSPQVSTRALHYPAFRRYLTGQIFSIVGVMMQSVAIGWQVYDLTHTPIALGFVGLAQFVPVLILTLPAGDVADRHDRRFVLALSMAGQAFCAALLFAISLFHFHALWLFYSAVAIFGAARAFSAPAGASLVPRLVPPEAVANAQAISSSAFQSAVIIAPALGGALYILGPVVVYGVCILCAVITGLINLSLPPTPPAPRGGHLDPSAWKRVAAGLAFVWRTPAVLGAISLDLFAVLLGGATALLPVYASDILHTDPIHLGILRAAPAIGGAAIGFFLARVPLGSRNGPLMFATVGVFGVATVLFGISTNFTVSLIMLIIMGASDMISVVIRTTLVQLATPDAMRGRVSAVNFLFIGASNELGEFESGFTAGLFGTVPAVVIGGLGTIAVVALWAWMFPSLRNLDRLTDLTAEETLA